MRKFAKLFRDPKAFFRDMQLVRQIMPPSFEDDLETYGSERDDAGQLKPVAFLVGFAAWKRACVSHYFPEFRLAFARKHAPRIERHLDAHPDKQVIVWGRDTPSDLSRYCRAAGLSVWHMEDGFVRSVGLGAQRCLPYSLVVDKSGIYFDATRSSDLEQLLNAYDFAADPTLLMRAEACMARMAEWGVSKYNGAPRMSPTEIFGQADKRRRRILVIGQVEDDASIRYGCTVPMDNAALLQLALRECDGADVFYKPHPDVVAERRKKRSRPEVVEGLTGVIEQACSIPDALRSVDHVYTISSLSGFEALIRGIRVTCVGAPFYSGWGLTDDRQATPRRTRKLTVAELFAGAFLLYPQYRDVDSGEPLSLEQTIERIVAERQLLR